jgi:hypothetical protein
VVAFSRGELPKGVKLPNEPNSVHAGLVFYNWLWANEANFGGVQGEELDENCPWGGVGGCE